MKRKTNKRAFEFALVAFLIALLLVLLLVKYFDLGKETLVNDSEYTQINSGKESCLNCHGTITGFSEYHNPEFIGCVSCHLGNGLESDKDKSHEGMVLVPGNLSNAEETCGKCHASELDKIKTSLMSTNSGIVAVDKFIFGEADSPNGLYHIRDIEYTASEKHLRDLCATCHLGSDKTELGEINQLSRGGGCIACHLNYSEKAKHQLTEYLDTDKKKIPNTHPATDIFVNDIHCFGCHSRSSRISTNYEGWHETLMDEIEVQGKPGYRVLEDKRVFAKREDDVHHNKGMLCIDCHTSHEVMGDGKQYAHAEQAVKLQCRDCHYTEAPNTIAYDSLDNESLLVFLHRKYEHSDKRILITQKDRHPLVNTYVDGDNAYLIGKKDGDLHTIKPQSEVCSRDSAHKNISCSSCHSSWTNKCIGCHNVFDKDDVDGYDLLAKKDVKGQWVEHVAEFLTSYPSLGVRESKDGKHYEPAIPGMIMTIDKGSFEQDIENVDVAFHRLFAPNSPHTTTKKVRDCKSCHSDPSTLGYGSGELEYRTDQGVGTWHFTPDYALNSNDELPEDAWVGFLNGQNQDKINSTRTDFRPLSISEQQRILMVGACLQCHSGESEVMQTSLSDFNKMIDRRSVECVLPNW